jgi:hypothetical protein
VRQLQRLGHWLAGLGPGGFGRRVSGQGGGAARIVLGLLHPRRLQKTYHAAGGGCRNWACQVRSWSSEGAGLDLGTGGRLDRLHIRVHLWGVSRLIRRLLVVTGARCPLTNPVVAAVELQATTEPHCSRGVQPGGIYVYVVQRGPTPGGPGSGLRQGRKRFLCQLPLWFYIYYASSRWGLSLLDARVAPNRISTQIRVRCSQRNG